MTRIAGAKGAAFVTAVAAAVVKRVLQCFLLALLAAGCTSSSLPLSSSAVSAGNTDSSVSLESLLSEIVQWDKDRSPLAGLYAGQHVSAISPVDLKDFVRHHDQAVAYRSALEDYSLQDASVQERLGQQVMIFKLTDLIDRLAFGEHLIPMSAEGGFYNSLASVSRRVPLSSASDYAALLAWLPQYADYLTSHIPLLREGIKRGRVAPVVVVENNLRMLRKLAEDPFSQNSAMAMFRGMPDSISKSQQTTLRADAARTFEQELQPAYRALLEFLSNDYLSQAPLKPGLLVQPEGARHYENRVRFFTTLPLSADEVFDLGEREVQRIEGAMDSVRESLKFEGSRAAFISKLRTDPQHYATSGQALLERAAWLAKKIEGKLPRWFDPLYELPFTVQPVPASIAPTYTSGRYLSGDAAKSRPGVYWVNTTALDSRALFNLPALTLHESVPGHHLQHARASELQDVHPFRNEYYISAFGEGWGLYAEYLGEEMGMYETPYERFGRLSYEMWRACRLVVDVGIHHRGWSRARAIDYLASRTALSELEVKNEIDRYIGWPGQALAYKLGELTILGLRREAEAQLKERFDVKAFHDAVLKNGSLPLDLLIEQVRLALGLSDAGLPEGIRPQKVSAHTRIQ